MIVSTKGPCLVCGYPQWESTYVGRGRPPLSHYFCPTCVERAEAIASPRTQSVEHIVSLLKGVSATGRQRTERQREQARQARRRQYQRIKENPEKLEAHRKASREGMRKLRQAVGRGR